MHNHLEKRNCGNSYILEVVDVFPPWFLVSYGLLLCGIVGVEGISLRIDQGDIVVELYRG